MQEIDIIVAMFEKMRYNRLWIILLVESTFKGGFKRHIPRIQMLQHQVVIEVAVPHLS